MNHCLIAIQFLGQSGEVTGGHKSYINAIGKMPLMGTPLLLGPWSYVVDFYAGSFKVLMVSAIPFY